MVIQGMQQPVDETLLSFEDLFPGRLYFKPVCSVDLGKLPHYPRSPGPLKHELIAHNPPLIQVLFHRPDKNDLPAGLLYPSQLYENPINLKARLFLKLPFRRIQGALVLLEKAFGYRPGSLVLPRPQGPTGMDEQDLKMIVLKPERQDPAALFAHIIFINLTCILIDGSCLCLSPFSRRLSWWTI